MPAPFGPYRLLRALGTGGTAEVFLAEPTAAGVPARIILKRLLPEMARYQEAIDSFLGEARLALKFAHPNVRRVHDFGRIGSDYFMALEYVRGVCLADFAIARPDLPRRAPGAVVRVALDVCAALEHVHEHGVVHGDVSPRNVLVSADGVAKLTDFGCAIRTAVEPSRASRPVRGTYGYMSPEQVRGEPMDCRSDLFSTGVLLWELLAGRRLFRRPAQHLTLVAVVSDPVPPLGQEPFDRILDRALAKHPDARTPNARALAAALEAAAAELGIDARPAVLAAEMARIPIDEP